MKKLALKSVIKSEKILFFGKKKTKERLEVQAQATILSMLRLIGVYLDIDVRTFLRYRLADSAKHTFSVNGHFGVQKV